VEMSSWPAIAAANNAEWCDAVCRTHGINAERDGHAWSSPTRTPPLYPDAVTLVADASASELLARIDASPGCSVKDSFASLDLTGYGFRVLFEAQWIVRSPSEMRAASARTRWTIVRDVETFRAWEDAWRGPDGPAGVLRADLLRMKTVTLLAEQMNDRIVGGAVLNHGTKAVGISNFFSEDSTISGSWQGCLALANAVSPGATLVGYESGDALDVARRHAFKVVGPLRVWLRDGGGAAARANTRRLLRS